MGSNSLAIMSISIMQDRRWRHLERLQQQMECKMRALHDLSDRLRALSQKLDTVPIGEFQEPGILFVMIESSFSDGAIDVDLDEVLDQMQSGTFKQSSLSGLDRVALENLKDEVSEKLESTAHLELMQDLDVCSFRYLIHSGLIIQRSCVHHVKSAVFASCM
jgi:hypothetical protein